MLRISGPKSQRPSPRRVDGGCDGSCARSSEPSASHTNSQSVRRDWGRLVPDNLTPQQRSYMMSRVRSRDTAPELVVRTMAHARGLRFRTHCGWLPGRPDLVFSASGVVVFVDGDYWHGWRFPIWRDKLAPYWQDKIERNRCRDRRNFARLRRLGWHVIRLWEHEIERDPHSCIDRIERVVRRSQDDSSAALRSATSTCIRRVRASA